MKRAATTTSVFDTLAPLREIIDLHAAVPIRPGCVGCRVCVDKLSRKGD